MRLDPDFMLIRFAFGGMFYLFISLQNFELRLGFFIDWLFAVNQIPEVHKLVVPKMSWTKMEGWQRGDGFVVFCPLP